MTQVHVTIHNSNRTDTTTSNNDDNSSNDRKTLVNVIEEFVNTRFMLIALIITNTISLFFIWFRLAFPFEADVIIIYNNSNEIQSYLIALKFGLTAMITILMQHLYYFRLFKSASDNNIIAICKLTISIVAPGLLGAGIGSGLGAGIGCLIGIIIGAGVGFALRNIWGEEQQQEVSKFTSKKKNSHLFLWLSQFIYLSIFILTGIVTFAVASSSSRFGTYLLLFNPTRLVVIFSVACIYLSQTEPQTFLPYIGTFTAIMYQACQVISVYDFIPISQYLNLIFKIITYIGCTIYVASFMLRNVKYFLSNKSFDENDLPRLIVCVGFIVYIIAINVLNKDVYNLSTSEEVSATLLQRLYSLFLSLLYLSQAPSVIVASEITNMIFQIARSRAEESTKYQILSKVIPKHLLKMTLDRRLIPTDHYNVCLFYSKTTNTTQPPLAISNTNTILGEIMTISNDGAIGTLTMINNVNCIMNLCMNICNVNRVETNGNSYLAEAGVAYTDTVINNINLILNFAVLVKLSLKKILKNQFQLRIGIHCGSCIGGLVHTSTLVPSFCLSGETVNVVKQLESQCDIDKIYITDSVKNHCKSSIDCSEIGVIEFDIMRGNTTAKGLLKTYCFEDFKKPKNFDALVSQIETEFNKVQPTIVIKDGYNVKQITKRRGSSRGLNSDMSELSALSYSDF